LRQNPDNVTPYYLVSGVKLPGRSPEWPKIDLGYVYCEQREYEAAHAAYREALAVFAELGHKRGLARVLEGAACLAAARGQATRALRLAAAAAHMRRVIHAPLPQAEQARLEQSLSSAWKLLGGTAGEDAWAEGSAMSAEIAIDYSLESLR
jgi:hypothetical protein